MTAPDPDACPAWERVFDLTDRLPVPGGWIYSNSEHGWAVFVPAPSRMVALQKHGVRRHAVVRVDSVTVINEVAQGGCEIYTSESGRPLHVNGSASEVAGKLGLAAGL